MASPEPPRRRTLVIGFLGALIPLAALLGLQYVWLSRLAHTTAIAHQASLHQFLESVGGEVRYFYRSAAERALNLPAPILLGDHLKEEAAHYWASRPVEGVSRLFLVDYSRDPFGNYYVFDEDLQKLRKLVASEEALAMIAACNPWQALSYWGGRAELVEATVDERDPAYRIVLKPITDDDNHVIGVAGMILDDAFFRKQLLPEVLGGVMKSFFPDRQAERVLVRVRNGSGEVIYQAGGESPYAAAPAAARAPGTAAGVPAGAAGAAGAAAAEPAAVSVPYDPSEDVENFPFVFRDWSVSLRSVGRTPEEVATESFLGNLTLAALLALTLGGAMLWTFRATTRAMNLSELKADFVSNVSHELRTPLSSIRVFGEFLKSGRAEDPETVRRYGRHIEAESRRLSRLIDNILEFSRIESGSREYHFAPASLTEVVETAVEAFQVRLRDRGFDITLDRGDPPLPAFPFDADAMGQVFHNLLDNAVKYSGDAREIRVKLEQAGDSAVATVEDRGIGIPASDQDKVFDRFHRVGTSLVHDVKGSGLGLSIVQSVVQAHGGRVEIDSEPGRGTAVRVRLPMSGGRPGPRPEPRSG